MLRAFSDLREANDVSGRGGGMLLSVLQILSPAAITPVSLVFFFLRRLAGGGETESDLSKGSGPGPAFACEEAFGAPLEVCVCVTASVTVSVAVPVAEAVKGWGICCFFLISEPLALTPEPPRGKLPKLPEIVAESPEAPEGSRGGNWFWSLLVSGTVVSDKGCTPILASDLACFRTWRDTA